MTSRCATAYRGVRERVAGIARDLHDPAAAAVVPATPAWSVHDLLAHLVGVARDAVDGRLDGVSSEAWTDAQVQRRRGVARDALLDEWGEYGPRFELRLARLPEEVGGQALLDAVTHEHDLRHATGVPGARDADAVAVAFDWMCAARGRGGRPAVRCRTEAGERVAGVGDPVATLTASRFELLRAATGRRTRAEVLAYGGDGGYDPQAVLLAPLFTMREVSLRER
jgi:uncharacterized protein (TIGR03083 family)